MESIIKLMEDFREESAPAAVEVEEEEDEGRSPPKKKSKMFDFSTFEDTPAQCSSSRGRIKKGNGQIFKSET